jgi:hypothetical protein
MKEVYHTDGRRIVFRLESAGMPDEHSGQAESKVNSGAFRAGIAGEIGRQVNEYFGSATLHPAPSEDAGISTWWSNAGYDQRKAYVFGFRDMDQLTNWFMWPEAMGSDEVMHAGRIGVYAVPDSEVQDGQFQTIFDCTDCELIEVLPTNATEYVPTPLYTREDGCTGGVTGWSHGPAYPFSVYGKGRYGVSFAWHVQGPNYDSSVERPKGWASGRDAEEHAIMMRTEMTQPPPEEAFYVISLGASAPVAQRQIDSVVGEGNARQVVGCYRGDLEFSFIIKADVYLKHRLSITKLLLAAKQECILYVDRKKHAFLCYKQRGLYRHRVFNGVWREVSQEEARGYDAWTRDGTVCYITQGG